MKCKAQWNVTPSWHEGKKPCQDSWSSHRKSAFIGTRPETNSSELGAAFKALVSCFKYDSLRASRKGSLPFPESQGKAEFQHCFYSNQKEEMFICRQNTHKASGGMHDKRRKVPILYMHTPGFLEAFFLTPISHLHPMNIIQLSFCEVVSTSLPSQKEWDGGLCFLHVETDLLPLLISEGFMGWL